MTQHFLRRMKCWIPTAISSFCIPYTYCYFWRWWVFFPVIIYFLKIIYFIIWAPQFFFESWIFQFESSMKQSLLSLYRFTSSIIRLINVIVVVLQREIIWIVSDDGGCEYAETSTEPLQRTNTSTRAGFNLLKIACTYITYSFSLRAVAILCLIFYNAMHCSILFIQSVNISCLA